MGKKQEKGRSGLGEHHIFPFQGVRLRVEAEVSTSRLSLFWTGSLEVLRGEGV